MRKCPVPEYPPKRSYNSRKRGELAEFENHLTELLDARSYRVYIPSTLHPAGRQAYGMQGARQRRRRKARRLWLGRRAKAFGPSPLQRAQKPKAPGAAAGGFLFGQAPVIQVRREATMSSNSSPTRLPSRRSIVDSSPSEMKIHASASASRSATIPPAAWARRMTSATKLCTSRSCARSARRISAIVGGLGQRLDPEVDEHDPRRSAFLEVGLADRAQPVRRIRLALERLVPERAHALPDRVQAGEVELALRGEVAVEDRLGDAGLTGDLRGGRAAVAALGEDAAGRLDDRLPALRPREARAHARRLDRRARVGVPVAAHERGGDDRGAEADRGADPHPKVSPWTNACGGLAPSAAADAARFATIAPMIAIPSAPPTWRKVLSTPEATPALSTGDRAHRGRGHRRHHERHPEAAEDERRAACARRSSAA